MLGTLPTDDQREAWMNEYVWSVAGAGDRFKSRYEAEPSSRLEFLDESVASIALNRRDAAREDAKAIIKRANQIRQERQFFGATPQFVAIYEYFRSGEHAAKWVEDVNSRKTPAYPFIPNSK